MSEEDHQAQKTACALDKEYGAKLPQSLKEDISIAYSKLLSDDPAIKVVGTRSYISLIKVAVVLNEDPRYDQLINYHTLRTIEALAILKDNWAAAMEICFKVEEELGFLAYSGYGNPEKPSGTAGLMNAAARQAATTTKQHGGTKQ